MYYPSILMDKQQIIEHYAGLNSNLQICPLLLGSLLEEETMNIKFTSGEWGLQSTYTLVEYENGYKEFTASAPIPTARLNVPVGTWFRGGRMLGETNQFDYPVPFQDLPSVSASIFINGYTNFCSYFLSTDLSVDGLKKTFPGLYLTGPETLTGISGVFSVTARGF